MLLISTYVVLYSPRRGFSLSELVFSILRSASTVPIHRLFSRHPFLVTPHLSPSYSFMGAVVLPRTSTIPVFPLRSSRPLHVAAAKVIKLAATNTTIVHPEVQHLAIRVTTINNYIRFVAVESGVFLPHVLFFFS